MQYYRLELSLFNKKMEEDNMKVILEVTGSVRIFVMTENYDEIWWPVHKLNKTHIIGGFNPKLNAFALYQIDEIVKL
jgi:hypothetical protein